MPKVGLVTIPPVPNLWGLYFPYDCEVLSAPPPLPQTFASVWAAPVMAWTPEAMAEMIRLMTLHTPCTTVWMPDQAERRVPSGTPGPPVAQLTASAGRLPMPPGISGVPFSATEADLSTWRRQRLWGERETRPQQHEKGGHTGPHQGRSERRKRTTDQAAGGPAHQAPGPASPAGGGAVRAGTAAREAQRRPRSPTWRRGGRVIVAVRGLRGGYDRRSGACGRRA